MIRPRSQSVFIWQLLLHLFGGSLWRIGDLKLSVLNNHPILSSLIHGPSPLHTVWAETGLNKVINSLNKPSIGDICVGYCYYYCNLLDHMFLHWLYCCCSSLQAVYPRCYQHPGGCWWKCLFRSELLGYGNVSPAQHSHIHTDRWWKEWSSNWIFKRNFFFKEDMIKELVKISFLTPGAVDQSIYICCPNFASFVYNWSYKCC